MQSIDSILCLGLVAAWPVIPLFWLPAHLFHGFLKRRMGFLTYVAVALLWLPIGWAVLHFRQTVLAHQFELAAPVRLAGWIFFIAGSALQYWTARVMGPVIFGVPEVTTAMESRHVTEPPFNWCRHPTYLAHSMIFGGAALATGYTALFIVALADALIVHLFIIPFEERELLKRLGSSYSEYLATTPKFFPRPATILKTETSKGEKLP